MLSGSTTSRYTSKPSTRLVWQMQITQPCFSTATQNWKTYKNWTNSSRLHSFHCISSFSLVFNSSVQTDSEWKFEVETAIKVCRQAGYHDHALFLAKKHSQHDWYLKILLEDLKDYDNALDYISTLSFSEVKTLLFKFPFYPYLNGTYSRQKKT